MIEARRALALAGGFLGAKAVQGQTPASAGARRSLGDAGGRPMLAACIAVLAAVTGFAGPSHAQRPTTAALGDGPFVYHTAGADFRVAVVTKGLVHPWAVAFLPDGVMLVTERPGRIRIVRNGVLEPAPIPGIPAVLNDGLLGGLLDIAVDPNFAQNHFVYFAYNKPGPDLGPKDTPQGVLVPSIGHKGMGHTARNAIGRGVWDGRTLTDIRDIFIDNSLIDDSISQSSGIRIVFGRDGKLYMSSGAPNLPALSGKYAHTRGGAAQDPGSDGGKVMRLNADGTIPKDNPFVGKAGYRPEIYTMGHRNILGMALNPYTGVVWTDENGPQDDDKLIALKAGANYGWPIVGAGRDYTGDHIGGPLALGDPSAVNPGYQTGSLPGIEQPFLFWVPAIAVSGLSFYNADHFPRWKTSIFVGSLKYRRLERHVLNDKGLPIRREYLLEDLKQRIRDVRQGPDGYLYVLTDEDQGALLRLEPLTSSASDGGR